MSTTRYLDFDSTYRNRNCYPCPADFNVNITCSKSSNDGIGRIYIKKILLN